MLTKKFRFIEPARPYRELHLLSEIARSPNVSQRGLAATALLGPTMVNRYLGEMERERWVKVEGETNRTFRYRLTTAGEDHRDELFFQASQEIVQFYGLVKQEFHRRILEHVKQGARRAVLFGAAETAEIVCAAAEGTGLAIVGIVDSDPAKQDRSIGLIRVTAPESIPSLSPDTVLITSFGHADEIHAQIRYLESQSIRVTRI